MRAIFGLALAAAILSAPVAAAARDAADRLFASQDILPITIKGPIERLIANRSATSEPVEASLMVQGDPSAPIPIKLSLRGVTRRKADTCAFPPLRVDFLGSAPETSPFAGQKRLKLVTHCQTAPSFQQYILLEYTAYRLYNIITPQSFNARLAMVDYTEPDGRVVASRIGFFLESEKDLARRNGQHEAETGDKIAVAQLDPRAAAREALFEDMIGNLDWSMTAGPKGGGCCHNTKLISEKNATEGLIPVPYDFDAAGLVDTPYAAPPNGSDLEDVTTRRYRGYCVHNAEAQTIASEFRDHYTQFLAALDATPQLEAAPRRKAAAYLSGFFRDIATADAVSANLLRSCRPT